MKSEALAVIEPAPIESPMPRVSPSTVRYLKNSRAKATRKGYARDFARFARWCDERGLSSLPATPETVANYASHRADQGRKLSTIRREVAAIARQHKLHPARDAEGRPLPPPTQAEGVRETLSGIARELGSMVDKAPPILRDDLRVMAATFEGGSLRDVRDRAVLLLGWLTVCRRSELIALNVEDFKVTADGAEVLIRRSKNDQEGKGLTKICYYAKREPELCAVIAAQRWLRLSGHKSGPLFPTIWNNGKVGRGRMDGESVARIVQRAAKRAGIEDRAFAAHSLRAGGISQMAADGVPLDAIKAHSGHKSVAVLLGYIRRAQAWDGKGATAGLL